MLDLHKTEFYYIIARERTINDAPYLYQFSYIPHDYLWSEEYDLAAYRSLYKRFFLDYNIQMAGETFTQQTRLITQTPQEVKDFLNLSNTIPCVLQTKTTRSKKNNRVLEYAEVYKHWKFFKYELSSSDCQ